MSGLTLDNRNLEKLYKDLEDKIAFYTPEYSFDWETGDFGVLLSKVFMKMFLGTIHRYNQVPMKHYIEFLNMMNVTSSPPNSSIGPVVFKGGRTFLEKGTQLLVKSDEKEEKPFELIDPVQVVDSKLTHLFQVDKKRDIINDLSEQLTKSFQLLNHKGEKNVQSHECYIQSTQLHGMNTHTMLELYFVDDVVDREIDFMTLLEKEVIWQISSEDWLTLVPEEIYENKVTFRLKNLPLSKVQLQDKEEVFIKLQLPLNEDHVSYGIKDIKIRTFSDDVIKPDILFSNDIQCVEDEIFPFTEILQPYNMFYIGCDEVMSKKGSEISLRLDFDLEDRRFYQEPEPTKYKVVMKEAEFISINRTDAYINHLIWEYWNGLRWCPLEITGISNPFSKDYEEKYYETTFICPNDMVNYLVNGVEMPWIRIRLVSITNAQKPYNTYKVPKIKNIALSFNYKNQVSIDDVMILENGQYHQQIQVYKPIDDKEHAIYLRFDKKPLYGPINLLIDAHHESERDISWWYSSSTWKPLSIVDGTDDLSKIGLVTFFGEEDFEEKNYFGVQGYWLRLVIEDALDEPINIKSIHLNGSWMKQQLTVVDERLSSSDDPMVFKTKMCPIIKEEIWINEFDALSQTAREDLLETGDYDILSEDKAYWVKWQPVNDFSLSELDDRHYLVDANEGLITFSDGTLSKKPPMKHIKINYSVVHGLEGNFGAYSSIKLKKTDPKISAIMNPLPCVNGSMAESDEDVIERGATKLFHRNRAITEWDMEQMVSEYTTNILKVKCFSQVDEELNYECGHVLLVVVLRACESMSFSFEMLQSALKEHMKHVASSILSDRLELSLIQAIPIVMDFHMDVYIEEGVAADAIHKSIREKIGAFLNIETGGYYGRGWDIGELPHSDMLSNVIQEIDPIISVKSFMVVAHKETSKGRININLQDCHEPYGIVKEGHYEIRLNYLK